MVPSACKVPSIISRLTGLALFLSALLTLLACGPAATPTPTVGFEPAATEVVPLPATEAPVAERDGDDGVQEAVQVLFDTWNRALQEKDAALFQSVLTRQLADSCRLEGLQSWLDEGEDFLAEVEVRAVFLDVADPSRAFAEITTGQQAGPAGASPTYPLPVALEDGTWRAGFLYGPVEICPYVVSDRPSGPDGRENEFPQIPGLDLNRREDILAAVPGARVVHGSFRNDSSVSSFSTGGRMSAIENQVNIHAELEMDLTAAEVVDLFLDGLKHPSWAIVDEGSSGEIGWFSWTVPDGEGRLWQGRLMVAPLLPGWWQVWLSLYSDDSDDTQ